MSGSPGTRSTRSLAWPIGFLVILVVGTLALLVGVGAATNSDPMTVAQKLVAALYPVSAVTDQGQEIRNLYDIVFAIAVVIFFIVEGLIVWTVLRYRRRPGDDELPAQTHGHFGAELLWTIVPSIVVAFLFVVSWQTLNSVDAVSATPDVKIRAVAAQFQWSFDYMPADWDGKDTNVEPLYTELTASRQLGAADGGMVVPTGRTIQLYLHSNDVIHAFYVPKFLFKRDVVPGVTNTFEFTVSETGQFNGQCAELCGTGHGAMLLSVVALTGAEYDAWLSQKIEEASATPPPPPSGQPEGPTLDLVAKDVKFDTHELAAPADAPFTIHLDNEDPSIPHDVVIRDGAGKDVFQGESFSGVDQRDYAVPPLPAGTYTFICSIHPIPDMTGTLTVGQ